MFVSGSRNRDGPKKSPEGEESVVYHFLREMGATLFISAPLQRLL